MFRSISSLALCLLGPVTVRAVPSLSTSLPPLSSARPLDELSVSISQQTFVDRGNAPIPNRDSNRLSARIRTRADSRPISGLLEVGGSFDTAVEKQTSFEVPEAYLSWRPDPSADSPAPSEGGAGALQTTVRVGRKREPWSRLDSYWTLGLWQPLNRFDGLRPSEQGLTGAFLDLQGNLANGTPTQLIVFGSPLYIPEQGPAYELQDGRFRTNNAWFPNPVDEAVILGQDTPVRYRLNIPPVGSVISHPSAGILLRLGNTGEPGAYGQIAYAWKPRNQLSLPFSGNLQTDPQNPEASVTISPQVAYHHVASLELVERGQYWTGGVSALLDVSEKESIPAGMTWQEYKPLTLLSPSFEFRVAPAEHYVPWIKLSTLHAFGGDQEVVSGDAKLEQNPFGPRLMYRQAASFELRGRFLNLGGFLKNWRIEHGLRWIEEFSEKGSVVMADIRLAARENWQVGLYADLLTSQLSEDQNPGFISRFRGNDRVGAQLSYVF